MVHALEEIHRVLTPRGLLIDLRPVADRWPVEVASGDSFFEAGRLIDLPEALEDDEAAAGALREVERRTLFALEEESDFSFFYSWDTPSEMKEYMEKEWEQFEKLDEQVFRAVQSAWASGGADARVRIRVSMLITRWRRLP
jgi:SAM-dependent methyltransferase